MLAMGLSQTDLAEEARLCHVSDKKSRQKRQRSNWVDPPTADANRRSAGMGHPGPICYTATDRQNRPGAPTFAAQCAVSLQSVLALSLMRAFRIWPALEPKRCWFVAPNRFVKRHPAVRGRRG